MIQGKNEVTRQSSNEQTARTRSNISLFGALRFHFFLSFLLLLWQVQWWSLNVYYYAHKMLQCRKGWSPSNQSI